MNVAITGGTGFVGERLVAYHVARGDSVRVLTRSAGPRTGSLAGIQWFTADLAEPGSSLESFVQDIDLLYHCAGEVSNPSRMQAVHVDGTTRLIEAARGQVGRWVQLSSVGAYGPVREGVVSEDWPEAPRGPYESTKTIADQRVREAARSGAFESVVLRPSTIYGTSMRNQSLYQLIAAIGRGLYFHIGRPGASANYVHVDNVVRALVLCGTHPAAAGKIFIVSDFCTFEDLVRWVAEPLGRKPLAWRLPEPLARLIAWVARSLPGFPLSPARVDALTVRARYSSREITSQLGYAPVTGIQEGLAGMAKAWRLRAQGCG